MNINDQFSGNKYLKSTDLQGAIARVKISDVRLEKLGDDTKIVLYFAGKEKGMVANKTNARTIADAYGDETDNWIGGMIEVFSMKVDFQGRMVDGLRVRIPRQAPARATIAPNARARAEQPAMAEAAPVERGGGYPDDLDDEIPFAPEWRG